MIVENLNHGRKVADNTGVCSPGMEQKSLAQGEVDPTD